MIIGKYIEEYLQLTYQINKKSDFSKADMLSHIFKYSGINLARASYSDINNFLSNFSYTKVGAHYELHYHGINLDVKYGTNTKWFEENGDSTEDKVGFFIQKDGTVHLRGGYIVDEDEVSNLEQKIKKIQEKSDKRFKSGLILGNDIVLYYDGDKRWPNDNRMVYSIDENGELIPAQEEHRYLKNDVDENKIDRNFIDVIINSLIGLNTEEVNDVLESGAINEDITLLDMLKLLNRLERSPLIEVVLNNLQEYYISETEFSKRDMLIEMAKSIQNIDMQDENDFYYQEVGDYYRLVYKNNLAKEGIRQSDELSSENNICYFTKDGQKVHTEVIKTVYGVNDGNSTMYEIYSNTTEIDSDLLDKINKLNESKHNEFFRIYILGNHIFGERILNGKIISEAYALNEKGELELITQRISRRVVDDMSELDLQLMQETAKAGVTVNDMIAMAESFSAQQIQHIESQMVVE